MYLQNSILQNSNFNSNGATETQVFGSKISLITLSDVLLTAASFIIVITALIPCLGFMKRRLRCLFDTKIKKTTRSESTISSASELKHHKIHIQSQIEFQEFTKRYEMLAADSCCKLSEEFEDLKIKENIPYTIADLPVNRSKNRFANILPFDRTRVVLDSLENVDGSDYINANYISGFQCSQEYIATQGPLKSTVNDFWRMCWQSRAKTIIMLTKCVDKDREKCFRYWPSGSLPEEYGDIEVEIIKESTEGHLTNKWIVTDLVIRQGNDERTLKHFQFLTWPDFGAVDPAGSLYQFIQEIRECVPYSTKSTIKEVAPIIVHCSAGVGRSGTLIAVDIAIQQIKANKNVDIFGIVKNMRSERIWMVQTEQQYQCVYKCILAIKERDSDTHTSYSRRLQSTFESS